jgi:hypothetical protein
MAGCVSLLAAAAISACGGGQSNAQGGISVAAVKSGFTELDPRPADTQGAEIVKFAGSPSRKSIPPGLSDSAPGQIPAQDPASAPEAPAPAPAPAASSSLTNTVPAVDTSKIPMGSPGYGTDMVMATTELPAPSDGNGAFRTVCDFSHMSFDDPIVYPGQPGRSHLHVFFGNTGTDANSTPASIAGTGNSTCHGGTINRTAYWAPAMIDSKDGTPVIPAAMLAYYKTGYNGVDPASVQPMPAGLRMIAGNSAAKAPIAWGPTNFACIDATGNGANLDHLPTDCPVGNIIYARVTFPQCWDGVNLDSPDHKSHMAYPSGGCPSTHPIAVPEVTVTVQYPVTDAAALARWRLSSDNYDPSLPAGYSAHADWFMGWKPEFMAAFVEGCDQPAKDCHAHLLGNGQRMLP